LDFLEKDIDKIAYEDYVATAKAIQREQARSVCKNNRKDFIKRF